MVVECVRPFFFDSLRNDIRVAFAPVNYLPAFYGRLRRTAVPGCGRIWTPAKNGPTVETELAPLVEELRYLQRRMLGITRDLRRLHFWDAALATARAFADLDKAIFEVEGSEHGTDENDAA